MIKKILRSFVNIIANLSSMIIGKIKILLAKVKIPWHFKQLPRSLSKIERYLILGLGLAIVVCGVFYYHQYQQNKHRQLEPTVGGSYIEGILKEDLEYNISHLANVGLVRFNEKNEIQPDLAESWEIQPDGKEIVFKLRSGFEPNKIAELLSQRMVEKWKDIKIEAAGSNEIKLLLPQPLSPILSEATQPIFPYGPYKVDKQNDKEVVLIINQEYYFTKPNIAKIIFKIYPNVKSLTNAAKAGKMTGIGKYTVESKKYTLYKMPLSRHTVLFFNLDREPCKDTNVRQKLAKGEKLDKEVSFNLITSDSADNIAKAEEIKKKWEALGAKININKVDNLTMKKTIIPNRDYDLLLYGIDYGTDPDPYPFWHTSQKGNSGNNLSNFSNFEADALLEKGRATYDKAQRDDLYGKFQKILEQEVPAIFLEQDVYQYQVKPEVKGIKEYSGIQAGSRFDFISQWYIKVKKK